MFGGQKPQNKYTSVDHQTAYEEYFRSRNFSSAARAVGDLPSLVVTVRRWAQADFACREGCPWHGWDELIAEAESRVRGQVDGVTIAGDSTALEAYDDQEQQIATRKEALAVCVRSNLERLVHWELLYAKLFYWAFGEILPVPLQDNEGNRLTSHEIEKRYRAGCRPKTLDAAVRTLAIVQGQIEELKKQVGLAPRDGEEKPAGPVTNTIETLTVEKARELAKLIEKLRPILSQEEMDLLPALCGANSASLLANEPGRNSPATDS